MTLSERASNAAAQLTLIAVFFLPFSKSAAETAGITAVVLWAICGSPSRLRSAPRPALLLYAIFLGAVVLSFVHVPTAHLPESLRGALKWLKYIGFFFMASDLFGEPVRLRRLVSVFLASLVLVVINGYIQIWTGSDLLKGYTADLPGRFVRMTSSFGSPNDLAAFLLIGVPLAFVRWVELRVWSPRSIVALTALAFLTIALAMTLSRAAVLALAVAATIHVLRYRPKALCAVMAGLVGFFVSTPFIFEMLIKSLRMGDITVSERVRIWETTWAMIRAHPLIGNGVNTYYALFPVFAPADESYRGYAHNSYLQMWAEIGLIGTLTFITAIAWFLTRILLRPQRSHAQSALWVGLAAFCLQAAVDTHFHALQTSYLFWIFWGVLCASPDLKRAPAI